MAHTLAFILCIIAFSLSQNVAVTSFSRGDTEVARKIEPHFACGAFQIATASDVVSSRPSPFRIDTFDLTLPVKDSVNVTVQRFRNNHGIVFDAVVFRDTENLVFMSTRGETFFSWFPGFSWKPVACRDEGRHVGWYFERDASSPRSSSNLASEGGLVENQPFYLIILDRFKIVDEDGWEYAWSASARSFVSTTLTQGRREGSSESPPPMRVSRAGAPKRREL